MEEVNDRTHASSSPQELAIHFLLRHAECRSALTGQTGADRPYGAIASSRSDGPATHLVAVELPRSEENRSGKNAVGAGVTEDDSCTARFLRAYAAARHMGVDADTLSRVQKARISGVDAESDLKGDDKKG